MKRIVVAICALSMLAGAVSCKKDDLNPDENYTNPTYVEGVFEPGRHLASVMGPGVSQLWSWSDTEPQQLLSISDLVNSGTYSFTFKGSGRMASASYTAGGNSIAYSYEYDEGTLDRITVRQNGNIAAVGTAGYAGGKITRIDYSDLSSPFLLQFANQYLGLNLATDVNIRFNNPSFSDTYVWNGENVTSENFVANLNGTITLSQLANLAGDAIEETLGSYASMILPLLVQYMGDSTQNINITINAAITNTYDNKYNPYRGFWGDGLLMQPQALSANNVTSSTVTGTTNMEVTLSLPTECPEILSQYATIWNLVVAMINGQTFSQDMPINVAHTRTYQYNNIGFPTSYTNENGETFTLTYKEDK